MIFPGFVTIYKDTNKFIHLYFFPGITEMGLPFFNILDLSNCAVTYKEIHHSDNSIEYIFDNKHIIKIACKLVASNNKTYTKILTVN